MYVFLYLLYACVQAILVVRHLYKINDLLEDDLAKCFIVTVIVAPAITIVLFVKLGANLIKWSATYKNEVRHD